MRNYYRPDYRHHQEGFHRTRRRRQAVRFAKGALAGLAAAAAAALLAAAWVSLGPGWLRSQAARLGLFRVEAVEVTGNRRLDAAAVAAAAGVGRGGSLLACDIDAARRRLAAEPWVAAATVRRRFPGTIVVEIAEREPAAVVRADAEYLVDAGGAVIGPRAAGDWRELPVIAGVEAAGGVLSARGARDLAAGLELVAAIREVGFPALAAVDHVDVADPEDAVIVPVGGRPLVHAGRGGAAVRLARWKLVAPDMAQRWPEVEYVDLRADGQVVALPAPAPAPPGVGAPAAPAGAAPAPARTAPKPAPPRGRDA